jgi:hypothetical protein
MRDLVPLLSEEARRGYGGGEKRVLQIQTSSIAVQLANLLAMLLVVYFGSEMAVTKIIYRIPKNQCSGSVTFWYLPLINGSGSGSCYFRR